MGDQVTKKYIFLEQLEALPLVSDRFGTFHTTQCLKNNLFLQPQDRNTHLIAYLTSKQRKI